LNENGPEARTLDGGLLPTAGRTDALDTLASRFVAAKDGAARATILSETNALVSSEPKAEAYVKVMTKAIQKGIEWIDTEEARVAKMAESESIGKAKKIDLLYRKNVLSAFE
jgi:protein disulfide-isomerase A6